MSRRKKGELTEEEKFEVAIQTEKDLARLARTYTLLERNRAQGGDKGGKLQRQKKILDIFKKEQKELLTDLKVATAGSRVFTDDRNCNQIKDLLEQCNSFDEEIKHQVFHLDEIDGQIALIKKKVIEFESKQVTDEKYQLRVINGEKTVQTLENKLEVQIKKFCQISADNIILRQEIHHLLLERKQFNSMWDTLINNLCIGKKFMLDLIEQATIAYDQREDWVNKLNMLRQRAHNDLLNNINEMRTMQRKIDDDKMLQEFFSVKNQKRLMNDLEEAEKKKRRLNKENLEKKLERYLQILIAIKEFTGEERVQMISNNYAIQEEENFSMFKCINHLNGEMEDITDRLHELHLKIDAQNQLNAFRRDDQLKKIELLHDEYVKVKEITETKREELKNVNETMKTILVGIGQLFKMFQCRNDPLVKMLGSNQSITNNNVLLYLLILERNIEEIMMGCHYKEKVLGIPCGDRKDDTRWLLSRDQQIENIFKALLALKHVLEHFDISVLLEHKRGSKDTMTLAELKLIPVIEPIDRIVPTSPCALCVEHDQVADVIDILQFAVTKEEAKLRVKDKIEEAEQCLHNVSNCHLPKSRQIIQKRYQ